MQKLNMNARVTRACGSIERASDSGGDKRFGARRGQPLLWCLLLGLLVLSPATVRAQSAVDAFDPGEGATEGVLAVAAQQDGRVLIGGRFTGVAGHAVAGVARLNADGTLDPTFQPQTNGTVHALAAQPDGKVLVGGSFSQVGGQPHTGIARVNPNGTLDGGFNPSVEGTVFSIRTLKDGKVLIGGYFSKVGGQNRYCVARLNADGTLDAAFDSRGWADSYVFAVAELADGSLIVGGQFTYFGGRERARLAKLNPDGSVDIYYQSQTNGTVHALAVQPDGKVLVGGDFTQINGQARDRLARLNADGSLDTSFQGGANDSVRALATQADGRTLVGGEFTLVNGQARNRLARLGADGRLDVAFKPEPNGGVYAVEAQADGRAFVAGEFTEIGGQGRRRVARLVAADSYSPYNMADPSFTSPTSGMRAVAVQADGRILVGGWFNNENGQGTYIARFNSDGTRDHSFDAQVDGEVHAIAVQPDGKIVIGGRFYRVGYETRYFMARLNSDGSNDSTFSSFLNPPSPYYTTVRIIAVQRDSRILVVGPFSQSYGQPRNFFVRLNADGTLDEGFNPNPNGQPNALAVQADGKILLGGGFSQLCGQERKSIARLNRDGTLDASFNPNPNVTGGQIYAIAVQRNGRVLIGGSFTAAGGLNRMYLARLDGNGTVDEFIPWGGNYYTFHISSVTLQANGKIIISGENGRYMRLNADGTPDLPYGQYSGKRGDDPYSSVLQADGRSLRGGGGLRRLLNNEAALQELSVKLWPDNSATIFWSRGGAAPEVEQVSFEVSTDGHTYNHVGYATPASGGWILNNATLPLARNIFVRARGTHLSAVYRYYPNSYSGTATYESVRQLILYPSQQDGPPTY